MSLTALLLGVCVALLFSSASAGCSRRKEYRDTTTEEWNLFREALFSLQNRAGSRSGWTMWDDMTNFHLAHAGQTHSNPVFLPWHRAFLMYLEQTLRGLDPKYANVFIPYWSWSSDWSNPMSSPIFKSSSRYQYDVSVNKGDCDFERNVPSRHCLLRQYTASRVKFLSSEAMAQFLVKYNDFGSFARSLEGTPHGSLHVLIGGNSGDLTQMYSPNDPLFWLIHSSLDRLWYNWQLLDTGNRLTDFGGNSLNTVIPGMNVNVGYIMNYNNFCLSYQDYSADSQLNINSLRSRKSSGAEDAVVASLADVSDCLPPPLPDSWLEANGLQPSAVRQIESDFHQIISRTQTSKECSTSSASDLNNNTNTTTQGTTQSVTVTTTLGSTIPAWGVALLILGACIVVLMSVVVVLAIRSRM